jgi:hypothetical protein
LRAAGADLKLRSDDLYRHVANGMTIYRIDPFIQQVMRESS